MKLPLFAWTENDFPPCILFQLSNECTWFSSYYLINKIQKFKTPLNLLKPCLERKQRYTLDLCFCDLFYTHDSNIEGQAPWAETSLTFRKRSSHPQQPTQAHGAPLSKSLWPIEALFIRGRSGQYLLMLFSKVNPLATWLEDQAAFVVDMIADEWLHRRMKNECIAYSM